MRVKVPCRYIILETVQGLQELFQVLWVLQGLSTRVMGVIDEITEVLQGVIEFMRVTWWVIIEVFHNLQVGF